MHKKEFICVILNLKKGEAYAYETTPFSRQRGCYIRRVERNKYLVVILKGLGAKTN
jgi:hypothetical protein